MDPVPPADMLTVSGRKRKRNSLLTFIECHAKKKKKIRVSGFFWKNKDLAPLGAWSHLASVGRSCVVAAPLWTACELSACHWPLLLWGPLTPWPPARYVYPMCKCFVAESMFLCIWRPTEKGQMTPDQEGPVFQEREESASPTGSEDQFLCLYANERACVKRMCLVRCFCGPCNSARSYGDPLGPDT